MTQANTGIDLSKYQLGWSDDEDYVFKPTKGLNEDLVREISWMKGEPNWMRDFRVKSLKQFEKGQCPIGVGICLKFILTTSTTT